MSVATILSAGPVTAKELRGQAWKLFAQAYDLDIENGDLPTRTPERATEYNGDDAGYSEVRIPSNYTPGDIFVSSYTGFLWSIEHESPESLHIVHEQNYIEELINATVLASRLERTAHVNAAAEREAEAVSA